MCLTTNLFAKELLTEIRVKQPFGVESKNCLKKLIRQSNGKVFFKFREKDRYKRYVGWIYSENLDINLEMIKRGCAWVYDRYAERKVLFKYQNLAKKNKLGLWKNANAIKPSDWRRLN